MPGANIDRVHQSSPTALPGNIPYRGIEWHSPAVPDYLIYIFNISARVFVDASGRGIIGRICLRADGVVAGDPTEVTIESIVAGKKSVKVSPGNPQQPYHYVTSFPQPVLIWKLDDDSNEIATKETDGVRFVVDMISPDNLTRSLNVRIDPATANSVGNDYAAKGIFFSLHNPPLKEDLEQAYARMETYYKALNQKADTLDHSDKLGLQRAVESNPDHIYAAYYFGKTFAFANRAVRPIDCPNCGEQKPAGRLFHQTSFGSICIEQSVEGWKSAVNSGIKKYDEVPEEFMWKQAKKATQVPPTGE